MKMKLLITGSSGFIGKKLIKFLKKKKISYEILETAKIKKKNLLKYNDITHLLHLGFRMKTAKSDLNKSKQKKNLNDIKTLSKHLDSKVKIIFISTIGVYCFKNTIKITKNKYCLSKFSCENFLIKNFNNYLIIRIPNIYGPDEKQSYLIPSILKRLKKNKKRIEINFYQDERDYIHIDDVIKILIESFKIKSNLITNIFSNNIHSVYDVVKIIIKKLKIKNCEIIKLKKVSDFAKGYYLKNKFNKDIGITKFIKFETGINYIKKNFKN